MKFTNYDWAQAILLYGLNAGTHKIALFKTLNHFYNKEQHTVYWQDLSEQYFKIYFDRLTNDPRPQQSNPFRRSVQETVFYKLKNNRINYDQAISEIGKDGFNDVIPRFQSFGKDKETLKNYFYEYQFGKKIILKDNFFEIPKNQMVSLEKEAEMKHSMLEGAYLIKRDNFKLENDIRNIYLTNGHDRKDLSDQRDFLRAYQSNICFLCGLELLENETPPVEHLIPRDLLQHDEEWNLTVSHRMCNENKLEALVGPHYIEKLFNRNENIIGSSHPWKGKIVASLGSTKNQRRKTLLNHYENAKQVYGNNYWMGDKDYNREKDLFFKRFLTVLNNGK